MSTTPVIDRHALVLSRVTLNGNPAQIVGIREDYATVVSLRGQGTASFAWERAETVVRNGGRFES